MRVHIVLKTKDLYDEGQPGFRTTVDSVCEKYICCKFIYSPF